MRLKRKRIIKIRYFFLNLSQFSRSIDTFRLGRFERFYGMFFILFCFSFFSRQYMVVKNFWKVMWMKLQNFSQFIFFWKRFIFRKADVFVFCRSCFLRSFFLNRIFWFQILFVVKEQRFRTLVERCCFWFFFRDCNKLERKKTYTVVVVLDVWVRFLSLFICCFSLVYTIQQIRGIKYMVKRISFF